MRLALMVTVYQVRVVPFLLRAAVSQLCDAPMTSLKIRLGKAFTGRTS